MYIRKNRPISALLYHWGVLTARLAKGSNVLTPNWCSLCRRFLAEVRGIAARKRPAAASRDCAEAGRLCWPEEAGRRHRLCQGRAPAPCGSGQRRRRQEIDRRRRRKRITVPPVNVVALLVGLGGHADAQLVLAGAIREADYQVLHVGGQLLVRERAGERDGAQAAVGVASAA